MSTLLEALSDGVEWLGVSQNFRLQVATYLGSILAMPLDGTSLVTMYRRSTLTELGLQVPQTWREMLAFIRTYTAAEERYRLSGREGQLPPYAICLPRGTTCTHQSYFQAVWSTIAQTHGVTQGVHFDTATLTPLIDSAAGVEAFRIFAELKTSAAPEEPDEPCARGSLGFARSRCALTLGAYAPQIAILLDANANVSVAQSDVGVSRLPGSDVVWARGGTQNGGTGVSGGGELKLCDTTLCPHSVLMDVVPAPADGGSTAGGRSSSTSSWHAQASLAAGPAPQPCLVNHAPQSPASLLVGAVNRRSDVLAQLLGYQLLLYLASPSRYLDTAAAGGEESSSASTSTSSKAAVSPLRVMEPVRPALLSPSSTPVWAAAGHDQDEVLGALPVLAEATQHPNHAWGLRMTNGAYYREVLENIIEGIEQGLVVPDDMAAATLDELEHHSTNTSEAGLGAATSGPAVQHRHRGRALGQVTEFTSATKPVGLAAALSRAAALTSAYYPPSAYRNNYLASLVAHSMDHAHDLDPAASSQSSDGGTSTGVLVGAVLGAVGGVALVLTITVVLVVFGTRGGGVHAALNRRLPWLMMALGLRRRRFKPHNYDISEHAQVKAPGISERSALLVTDIEDSTRLWEEFAADVMSRALQLHHACIRHLIGDSFICAFISVKHAVAFATELQTQLLVLPWPQELLADKICMPVYTDLPEGFPFTHHEPEEMEAATPRGVADIDASGRAGPGEGACSPFASAPGAARSALRSGGRARRRGAAAVDVMDLSCSTARLDGFTQNGYNNTSGPPTPTAMSMSAAAQMVGRPRPSLAALEHICSMRRSQEGARRSNVAGGGRSMSAAALQGRLHFLRSSGASAIAHSSGGSSGSAGGGTPRSKAAAILASARAAASAAADRLGWDGAARGDSTGALPRLRIPLGRGSVPGSVEHSAASRAAIAAPAPASGDLLDGEEAPGAEEAGSAPLWGTHERSTTACVLQRERDSCMQQRRPPQLLIPTSVGGEEEFSSCSWFSSSGGGSGSEEEGCRNGGGGSTAGGGSCDRSDLPDGATISALTSGYYDLFSEPMSPAHNADAAAHTEQGQGHRHVHGGAHQGEEQGEAADPGGEPHHRRHRWHHCSRHSNGSQDEPGHLHGHGHEPRDRNSITVALPPVLPWLPSGRQAYAVNALAEVTANELVDMDGTAEALAGGPASFAPETGVATADDEKTDVFHCSDDNEDLLLSVTTALPTAQHHRSSIPYTTAAVPAAQSEGEESLRLYPHVSRVTGSLALAPRPSRLAAQDSAPAPGWAAGHRPPMLLVPQALDVEDTAGDAGADMCGNRDSRAAEQAQRSMTDIHTSPSVGALLRTAGGIATPASVKGMSGRPTAAGMAYDQVSDFASSAAGTPEVAAAAVAMEVLEAAMPPPLWTPPAPGHTLGQLLAELPPGSFFTAAAAVGRTRRLLMFRGLRVRVGIHTGVSSAAEMQYNAASARIVYGGPCVAMCKAIADYANGGQIFLSAAAKEQLDEAVHRHNGGKPPGILMLRLGAYMKESSSTAAAVAAAAVTAAPASADANLLGQCTPRRLLSRMPPSSNNITALAGGGYSVGGIGRNSMLLQRAQTTGAESAAGAMPASVNGYSASAAVSRQTTRADTGALVGPASAVRHSSGLQSAAPGALCTAQLAASASGTATPTAPLANKGPALLPSSLMLPASTSNIEAPQQQQEQWQQPRPHSGIPKARSLMQLQQQTEPVSSGSRRRALAGESGVAAGQSAAPIKETAVYWLTSSSLSQRLALVARPRVPKDHSPLQDVYSAPVGRLTYVVLQVPAATALMAWDAEVACGALRLLHDMARSTIRKYTHDAYLSCARPGELTAAFSSAAVAVRWAEGLRKELLHAPWSEALLAHELCEVVEAPESDSSVALSDFFEDEAAGTTDLDGQLRCAPRSFKPGRSRSGAPSAATASDMQRRVSTSSASVGVIGHLSRQQLRSCDAGADKGGGSSDGRNRGTSAQGLRGDAAVGSSMAAGGLAAWISSRLDKAGGAGVAGASAPASPLALGSTPRRRHATTAGVLAFNPTNAIGSATASPPSTPRASAAEGPGIVAPLVAAAAVGSSSVVGGAAQATSLPPAALEASGSASLMGPFTHVPSRLGLMHRPATTPQATSPLPHPAAATGTVATLSVSVTGGSASVSTTGLLAPQSAHVLSRKLVATPSLGASRPPCGDNSPRTSMSATPCGGGGDLQRPGASSAPDAAAGIDVAVEAGDGGTLAQPLEPAGIDCASMRVVSAGLSAYSREPEEGPLEAPAQGPSAASNTTTVHELTTSPRCSAQLAAPATTGSPSTATSATHLLLSGCNSIPRLHTNATPSPIVVLEPSCGGGRGRTTSMAAAVAEYMEARQSQARCGTGETGAPAAGCNSSICCQNSLSSALDSLQAGELQAAPLEPTSIDEPLAAAAGSGLSGAGTGPRGFSEGSAHGSRMLRSVPASLKLRFPRPAPAQRPPQPQPGTKQTATAGMPRLELSAGLAMAMARPGAAALPRTPSLPALAAPSDGGGAAVRMAPRLQLGYVRTGGRPSPLNDTPSPLGEQRPQSPLSTTSPRSPPGDTTPRQSPTHRPHSARPPLPHLHQQLRLGNAISLEAEFRQRIGAGLHVAPGAEHAAAAHGNGPASHRSKGADALETIAEPMPASALDGAAATAAESAAAARPGASPRTTVVPGEALAHRSQVVSLDEILPQRLDPQGLPLEWPPEQQLQLQQQLLQQAVAGTRCEDTVAGADGRTQHLLLRGLRIRVGIATGSVTWSAADHTHELSYSGKPVRLAERLAGAVAAGGQVVCCAVTCQEALAAQQYELQLAAAVGQRGSNGNGNRASAGRSLSAQPSSIAEAAQERDPAGVAVDGSAAQAVADAAGASSLVDNAPMLMAFMPVMEGHAPAYLGRVRDKKKRWKQVVYVVSLFPPDAPPPSLAAVAAVNRPRLPPAVPPTPAVDRHSGSLMPLSRSPATPAGTPRGVGFGSGSGFFPPTPSTARSHAPMPLLKLAGAARTGMAAVAAVAAAAGLKQPSRAALAVTPPGARLTSAAGSFVGRVNTGNSVPAGGAGCGYGSMPLPKLLVPLAQVGAQAAKGGSQEQGVAPDRTEAGRESDVDGILIEAAASALDVI
ncbi:hypothetical protein HYH02_000455 [Chlamydomonas schloesseri]|uniref:Guanylate cyclase domain-containing protein n=1 Tax=Chlamydomonas schloesseri TaxID=2026947 RepID=A0A836BDC1_9CHLO|nr:hypothetical protein HYH02_000455 [Chlamydomonas schloesseri]|eukprot:KAG2454614.1 hypothetical protein HYH02_000455 [Chlamydomonas schloesseri]